MRMGVCVCVKGAAATDVYQYTQFKYLKRSDDSSAFSNQGSSDRRYKE